jgi:hypothetical protein
MIAKKGSGKYWILKDIYEIKLRGWSDPGGMNN